MAVYKRPGPPRPAASNPYKGGGMGAIKSGRPVAGGMGAIKPRTGGSKSPFSPPAGGGTLRTAATNMGPRGFTDAQKAQINKRLKAKVIKSTQN